MRGSYGDLMTAPIGRYQFLNFMKQTLPDDGHVHALVDFLAVRDLANVNWVPKNAVKRTSQEPPSAPHTP